MASIRSSTYAMVLAVCLTGSAGPVFSQDTALKNKLQDYFFDLSFGVDIDVIKSELRNNPEFKLYHDPNRDDKKTIVGSMARDKNLNPASTYNQIVIQYSTAAPKKSKKVSFKWSVNYKVEDLAIAAVDFEKLKSDFKPLCKDFTEKEATGQQKEQVSTLILKTDPAVVTIRLIRYNNFIHTLSLEYSDQWKIESIQVIKVNN